MSLEDIIKAWKSDEDSSEADVLASPVGEELSDEELKEATGGFCYITKIVICQYSGQNQ